MEEPLLKLHREFTDKEKIALLRQKVRDLEIKNNNQQSLIQALEDKIKRQAALILSEIGTEKEIEGKKFVREKTHLKLQKRHSEMQDRFWEVVRELNALKKVEVEKL